MFKKMLLQAISVPQPYPAVFFKSICCRIIICCINIKVVYQINYITQNLHRLSPSYDYIIGSFLFRLTFIQNNLIPGRNVTYYFLSYIGGPVAHAADMLRDEWDHEHAYNIHYIFTLF